MGSLRVWLERLVRPLRGTCLRCGRPWLIRGDRLRVGVVPHDTEYAGSLACFPLCEDCWANLAPSERLIHYRTLWQTWCAIPERAPAPGDWDLIRQAVLSGR